MRDPDVEALGDRKSAGDAEGKDPEPAAREPAQGFTNGRRAAVHAPQRVDEVDASGALRARHGREALLEVDRLVRNQLEQPAPIPSMHAFHPPPAECTGAVVDQGGPSRAHPRPATA